MANDHFTFKQFTIQQGRSVFRVGTDAVILGSAADVAGVRTALDIGAGTGVIALMLAQRCGAMVTAIEPDVPSFSDLVLNALGSPWKNRIETFNTDLQSFSTDRKFDLIISNPPFFSNSLRNPDPVKAGARHKDLLTDEDLLSGVDRLIEAEGHFEVILPAPESKIFIAEALKHRLFCNAIMKIRPLPSSAVNRQVLSFGRKKLHLTERDLTISTGQRQGYTEEYVALTREFYLKF